MHAWGVFAVRRAAQATGAPILARMFLLALLTYAALLTLTVTAHEAGHAAALRFLRRPATRVQVGFGPRLLRVGTWTWHALPLAGQVRRAAAAGAAAVVIVDDALLRCGSAAAPRFNQGCVVGSAERAAGSGFAGADDKRDWELAHAKGVPTVLVPRDAGLILRDMLAGTDESG